MPQNHYTRIQEILQPSLSQNPNVLRWDYEASNPASAEKDYKNPWNLNTYYHKKKDKETLKKNKK
jgi:hypothetical protein